MKKLLLLFVSILSAIAIQAQTLDKSLAMDIVSRHSNKISLSADDLANLRISNAYIDKSAGGAVIIYMQQTFKGIPVHNQIQVLSLKNDQLISKAGERIISIDKLTDNNNGIPSVPAGAAVMTAIAAKKLNPTGSATEISRSADGQKIEFTDLGVSRENVTAQLMWVPSEGKVKLAWQVYIVQNNSSDYWLIRVDALRNTVIDETNLTVYCNWDDPNHYILANHEHVATPATEKISFLNFPAVEQPANSPFLINSATYRVVPFPAESPIHPGGGHALRTDPWTMAPGNATSLKWHSDGTSDFNYSRGNNVWAQEDRNGNNGTGIPATSTTPDPLTFNFVPDYSVTPIQTAPVPNQQFNTTNLFYWNNIIHDLTYLYGFDEAAANFQANNQGRGGNGNDAVFADAQDGAGTNNAVFATPADGSSGRMQMYLWSGSPQKDGDVDNGVIVHEYTHGISNRLTGGGSAGCLGNAENMGEGWSDYYGLMYTHDWANAGLNDGFNNPRGIGTYVLGQAITGLGIRTQRYCTNLAINNRMYAASISTSSHTRGEIWCATLWDMTWNIIQQVNSINPNLFNVAGGGGNTIALRLVTQGMKLQPCSPGFLDGRDAILAADQLLYGGQYRCAIIQAFARRGMGFDAKQGSSGSVSDQIPGFSLGETNQLLTQNITQQFEGQNVVYTNTVTSGPCGSVLNYVLNTTLPSNVTYVSGGTYNITTRVVSFPVNMAANSSQAYSFTVMINNGSYFPTVSLLEDPVSSPTIPALWTATSTTSTNWVVSNARSHSAPSSYYSANLDVTSDQRLITTNNIALGATPPQLTFWHWYNTEFNYDGGVLEISTDGGTNWSDIGVGNFVSNGYTGSFDASTIIPGRQGFMGNSNGWIKTTVNLTPWANQSVKFRFRFTSDVGTNLEGWYVDDIQIKRQPTVDISSSLVNASGVLMSVRDTFTVILEAPVGCTPVTINTQPASTSSCTGSVATFSVAASGTALSYQWQVSTTGCAGTFTNIPGATSATYTTAATTTAMNNYAYKVIVSNSCPSSVTSACAVLTVNSTSAITAQPQAVTVCAGTNAVFSIAATGTGLSYQWQVSTNGGTTWTDITGASGTTLTIAPATSGQNGNQYRVLVSSACSATASTSAVAGLTVLDPVNITASPNNVNTCAGESATFTVAATGTGLSYQWQVSVDGSTYVNIPGATSATYTTGPLTLNQNGVRYRVVVSTATCGTQTSSVAALSVKSKPTVELTAAMYSALTPSNPSRLLATVSPPGINYVFQWFRDGNLLPNVTGPSLNVTIDSYGAYQVKVIDTLNGCSDESSLVTVRDSVSNQIFIYPNPTSGVFQLRYYSPASFTSNWVLNLYDAKGARIYSKQYPIMRTYDRMDVDISHLASGVYMVELIDNSGKRIATGRVRKM